MKKHLTGDHIIKGDKPMKGQNIKNLTLSSFVSYLFANSYTDDHNYIFNRNCYPIGQILVPGRELEGMYAQSVLQTQQGAAR